MDKEINNITLLDIIDKNSLQSIQDAFSYATGLASITIDDKGVPITTLSNSTDFCIKYTRNTKIGLERCTKCDAQAGERCAKTKSFIVYNCHAGLMDFSSPIIVNGKHLGSMIGGQALPQPPDREKIYNLAIELGINPEEYLKALDKVNVVPQKQINAAAELLYIVANTLSQTAHERIIVQETSKKVIKCVNKLTDNIQKISSLIELNCENLENIIYSIEDIYSISEEEGKQIEHTKLSIKNLKDIASQIMVLGFNASIESTRAGEFEESFQMIAQQIRTLAETYKKSSTLVESILNEIATYSNNLDKSADSSKEIVNKSIITAKNIKNLLDELSKIIKELEEYSKQS